MFKIKVLHGKKQIMKKESVPKTILVQRVVRVDCRTVNYQISVAIRLPLKLLPKTTADIENIDLMT